MAPIRALAPIAVAGGLLWLAGRRPRLDLEGRVVLITGGSRGLGLVLARELGARGCHLVLCARDSRELENARVELEGRGYSVMVVTCDVADPEEVHGLVQAATQQLGRIDVVVNNASIIQVGPLETMRLDDFQNAMAVNYGGLLHTTLAVLPQMKARGEGRIVNITSIGGKVSVPHLLPYSAAKFAAVGLSEGLRAELSKDGIVVTTVVPGLMRTGSPVNALFTGNREAEMGWFSLGDALPFTAMSAERAARRIADALVRGKAEVTLSWQAKALRLGHALLPGTTARVLGIVNRLLPESDGRAGAPTLGMHLSSRVAPSPLTTLMNRAAIRNNEFGGGRTPTPEHARKIGLSRGGERALTTEGGGRA